MDNIDLNELRRRLLANQQQGSSTDDTAVFITPEGRIQSNNRGVQNSSKVPDRTFA
jgi:hypothetical protein